MPAISLSVFFVLLLVVPTALPAYTIDVFPDYHDVNCTNPFTKSNGTHLYEALYHYKNDTILILKESGCFHLQEFVLVQDVVNYTIQGNGPAGNFVISCSDGVGLAFVGLKELVLQNFTIVGCGIRDKNTDEVSDALNKTVALFFHVPNNVSYGMFLGDCCDVVMSDVTVTKTSGIGLVVVNVIGNSTLSNLQLTENQSPLCFFSSAENVTSSDAVGGGIYVLYQNYYNNSLPDRPPNLTINNAYIHNNSYCSSYTTIATLYDQSKTAYNLGYTIGGGGGMGVSLAQLGYKVNALVVDSEFSNNTGWSNAGVYVGIFEGVGGSYLNFTRCEFKKNGYEDYSLQPLGVTSVASAFLLFNDVDFPNATISDLCDFKYIDSSAWLTISDSTFIGNTAYSCGTIESYAFRSPLVTESNENQFRIINCTFRENKAVNGPVLCLSSIEYASVYPALNITMSDVTVVNNTVVQMSEDSVYLVAQSSAQVVLSSSMLTVSGNSSFNDNSGGVVILSNSLLYLQDSITFTNNQAVVGGGMQVLSNSYLVIGNNSNITFAHNYAKTYGGGIYFSIPQSSLETGVDCFLFFEYMDPLCNYSSSCPPVEDMNITVSFIDNNATVGGAIYGSTLNSCPWFYPLRDSVQPGWKSSALQLLAILPQFNFNPAANDSSVISTLPSSIVINNSSSGILATPGQTVNLEVLAYDSFEYRVCAVISSASANSSVVQTQLGESGFFFLTYADLNGTLTPVTFVGLEASGSVETSLYSTQSYVQTVVNVSLDSCGLGFQYNPSNESCECIPELLEDGAACNVLSYQLMVQDGFWLGPGPSNSIEYSRCYYDYCIPGLKIFSPSDIDSQCNLNYNRTGYVCGSCEEGKSALFGTSKCGECSNYGLVWILVLAIVGVVAIFGISFLDITITQGYLNGFLFYCNCVNYFAVYLSPQYPLDLFFAPLQWVNLGLGIESCFYDGMTALTRIGLRFLFPLYLFLLMVILILLSRWFNLITRLHFSAAKTFATLLLLCYINISGTCIEILGFIEFKGIYHNMTYYGWLQDPNVEYGHGWHGFLVFVALVLMVVYVLPMPTLLLFPQFFYSFRFTQRFIPMYDAFWNPFKPNFRFWLGFRALLRLVPFCLALYASHPMNVFAFAVFTATLFFIQERLSPFQSYWRNALDGFFLANLFLLILGNLYYERLRDENLQYPPNYNIMLCMLLSMAYVGFFVILVIHVFLRFPNLQSKTVSVMYWLKEKVMRKSINLSSINAQNKLDSDDHSNIEQTQSFAVDTRLVHYSEFREPLLDDVGTVSLTTHSEIH